MDASRQHKPPRQALQVFVKLLRATEAVTSSVHRQLADENLTISQFGVLEALFHLGPLVQKDIAAKILKSTGNMTLVIDNLEKRGLVRRLKKEHDRRFFEVHLTGNGQELMERLFPEHAVRITERMSILDSEELQLLGSLLKKLGREYSDGKIEA